MPSLNMLICITHPKFKEPFVIIERLDGNLYVLKSLKSKRTYKYAQLRAMPEEVDADEYERSPAEALVGTIDSV